MKRWTKDEEQWLIDNYPKLGRKASCLYLNRSDACIRQKTSRMGLKQDRSSDFFQDWQKRAAKSKIGKKRPEQAKVFKRLHAEGKLRLTDERKKAVGIRTKEWIRINGHPRGSFGMKHSIDALKKMSDASIAMWKDKDSLVNTTEYRQYLSDRQHEYMLKHKNKNGHSRSKSGKRPDLNDQFFRSTWEANYARYLNYLVKFGTIYKWEYEPDTFVFDEVKRGTRSYMPDFKIWDDEYSEPYYVEVKGWMDSKSKTKLKRMAKYFPNVRVDLFVKKDYVELTNMISPFIIGWE